MLCILLVTLALPGLAAAQKLGLPPLQSDQYVLDLGELLDPEKEDELNESCRRIHADTGVVPLVLTIPVCKTLDKKKIRVESYAALALQQLSGGPLATHESEWPKRALIVVTRKELQSHIELSGPWTHSEFSAVRSIADELIDHYVGRENFWAGLSGGVDALYGLVQFNQLPKYPLTWSAIWKSVSKTIFYIVVVGFLIFHFGYRRLGAVVRVPAGQLHGPAREGNAARVLKQLERGAAVNAKDNEGFASIHHAVHGGYKGVLNHLLSYGADPNNLTRERETPLFFAARRGDLGIAEILLAKGARPNIVSRNDSSPISVAAEQNNFDIIKLFLDRGIDINARNTQGKTLLFFAVENKRPKLVDFLLSNSANAELPSADGRTPLVIAVKQGSGDILRLLLTAGAKVNANADHGMTALTQAVTKGDANIVGLLLSAGANPHAKIEMTQLVLDNDLDQDLKFTQILTALQLAKRLGDDSVITAIESANNRSILEAVEADDFAAVETMLAENPEAANGRTKRHHWSPLLLAVTNGKRDLVELLLKHGADPKASTADGYTALMYAARQGYTVLAKRLLDAGADAAVKHADLGTAADQAHQEGHEDLSLMLTCREELGEVSIHDAIIEGDIERVCRMLKKVPELANLPTPGRGWTPLHMAVHAGDIDLATVLLEHGADANAASSSGKTAVHQAAGEGDIQLLSLLIRYGADVNRRYKGKSALQRARNAGRSAVVQLIEGHMTTPKSARDSVK